MNKYIKPELDSTQANQEIWKEFFSLEAKITDTVDFKTIYVDMAGGDVLAGLLLSQIVFWFLPDKNGKTKLRVVHDNKLWLAKKRSEWWDEIRIKPQAVDRLLQILEDKKLIKTHLYKFNNTPTIHIRLTNTFLNEYCNWLEKRSLPDGYGQIDKMDLVKSTKSYNREYITKNTNYISNNNGEVHSEPPVSSESKLHSSWLAKQGIRKPTDLEVTTASKMPHIISDNWSHVLKSGWFGSEFAGWDTNYFSFYKPKHLRAFVSYFKKYRKLMGHDHPHITVQQIKAADTAFTRKNVNEEMINKHFQTYYGTGVDFNINHFATDGILQNRGYETM